MEPRPPLPPPPSPPAQPIQPGLQERFTHKNRLQEYAQRSALTLPSYHTIDEGFGHAGKFRSTVFLDGHAYSSSQTFARRKDAEQDAAKVALDTILEKIKDNGCVAVNEDKTLCKSILNEFAVKKNIEKATYKTTESKRLLPVFISVSDFDGKTYEGAPGRNKKEAEQLAARVVIQSILGKPDILLSEIINSKTKLYAELKQVKDETKPTSVQKLKKSKLEPVCETSVGLVENMTPVRGQSQCNGQLGLLGSQSTTASTSGKKRPRKRKKNVLKKKLVDGRLLDLIILD